MPLIKEIILENFMSYEYARVPLEPGLNIICGPNGSGKSSILLALAVALGQTYTERSRKLSDLIRRGKEMGRVTVVFNNSPVDGRRPVPSCRYDDYHVSRHLRRDGTYWYEAGFRSATKGEVDRVLSWLGINPENMLIIMHQNMLEEFSVINSQEKLVMVEEVVGIYEYREKIIQAKEKLSGTLSEEEAVNNLLERSRETLEHWRGKYEKYQRKKELLAKKADLRLKYRWAKCLRQERKASTIQGDIDKITRRKEKLREEFNDTVEVVADLERELEELSYNIESTHREIISLERSNAKFATEAKLLSSFAQTLKGITMSDTPVQEWTELAERAKAASIGLEDIIERISSCESDFVRSRSEADKKREDYVEARVKKALLEFRSDILDRELSVLRKDLRDAKEELEELVASARALSPRVESERKLMDILDDLRVVNAHLAGLVDLSSDVEGMYWNYRGLVGELEEKAKVVAQNRERTLKELNLRKKRWRSSIRELLSEVNETYIKMLSDLGATGDLRLVDDEDVETAGLELLVGFRGAVPTVLDAYTQSGGERTTAVMCFLLGLQQHIRSSVRAVDEFDVHMDPVNREMIMTQIISTLKDASGQYIVITPGRIMNLGEAVHVIVVQNVGGSSEVKVVG